ncbi:MAG: response regulator [Chloroflexi bacterium]|nr:response regulator [Chloroflexota bacterium]
MGEKPKVLVVDDDAGIRETMADILALEGYEVTLAADGEEAIAIAQRERFDVALLDIRMPKMDGVETLKILKKMAPEMRVIMITGFEVGDLADEAMEFGAEAVFRKPLDVATFLPVLLAASDSTAAPG